MKSSRTAQAAPMSADAFAGFLKLWLTPAGRIPAPGAGLDAYLRHANEREPLPESVRRAIGAEADRAA